MRNVEVVGVHPIEADEPCYLVELAICDHDREFNVAELTQVNENIRRGLWQAAYDERYLDMQSLEPLGFERPDRNEYRLVFFFHDLDLAKPLESSFGPLPLPPPSPRPGYLSFMIYDEPR